MKLFSITRAALTLGFLALTAQSAAALSCPARSGVPDGELASQTFANATLNECGYGAGSSSGHLLGNWGYGVMVVFYENGNEFTPASRSLSCSGSTSSIDTGTRLSERFGTQIYSTSCTLSYTDANGQTVSHSFDASTELQYSYYAEADVAVGTHSAFTVTNGWFNRVSPTVEITGLPADLSGTTPFDATITFSEGVVEFTANDITITGGSVTGLSGSGANYIATIAPTGQADVVISVAAAVAQDLAGNDNLASSSATVINATATETGAVIAQFMQGRANALLSNQLDLAGFLRGDGDGHFSMSAKNEGGYLSFASGHDKPVWAQLNANWFANSGAESSYVFGAVGRHTNSSDNLLLGGMLQFDMLSEINGAATVSGNGWMVGPYFVTKLPDQPLYFEGSVLYGQTYNQISPLGTFTDTFTTERWLATLGVSGQFVKDQLTLIPFLDASYTTDMQAAYVDGLGNPIAAQSIALAQMAAGLDFAMPIGAETSLNGGISGIWSHSVGTGVAATVVPGFEGGRARVDLGIDHSINAASTLSFSGFYDGIGAYDFTGYGVELDWAINF